MSRRLFPIWLNRIATVFLAVAVTGGVCVATPGGNDSDDGLDEPETRAVLLGGISEGMTIDRAVALYPEAGERFFTNNGHMEVFELGYEATESGDYFTVNGCDCGQVELEYGINV